MKKLLMFVLLVFWAVPIFAQIPKVNPDSIPFAPAANYGAGDYPSAVFCAPLDVDAYLDLAVASTGSDSVSILKNDGDGTFQTKVDYAVGDFPSSVFCADLNGDGHLDLALANQGSDSVSILRNNGDGTFQIKVDYAAGSHAHSVFCADLDGDSALDLAVTNHYGNSVSILKNDGDGTFQAKVDFGVGSYPRDIFCADLDGDSALDLVVTNTGSDNVSILKNDGNGSFPTRVDLAVGDNPHSVFCADLDGDSDLDLAVANFNSDNVSILKNDGNGAFPAKTEYDVGNGPISVFCADLNEDGHLDLAVANAYDDNVSVLKNTGDGTFQSKVDYSVGERPHSVFCADLDGDSDIDLATANPYDDNVSILINLIDERALPLVIAGPDINPGDGIHDDSPFEFNVTIAFVGQAIPDEGAAIDSTRWDFDDGVSIKDQLLVQHQYTGLYCQHLAILTAWDNWGLSASDTLAVRLLSAELPQITSIGAIYDGISHEDTIGTFISGLAASNTFSASVTIGDCPLDSVIFDLEGIMSQGYYETESGLWKTDFADIGYLPVGDNLLTVRAYDNSGNPGEKTAVVKMREIPSWYNGEWISLIEHHQAYQFVTSDGMPYYKMQVSIPEPPVQWGPYDFSIEPFFPDLSNHFRVFLGINGRFNIDGGWSRHEVGGELIAKLLGRGIDENVSVDEGDMRFEGPYNDLVGVTISGLGYEIPNQTLFGASGWLATFWVGAVQIDLLYSAAFGLQAYIDLGAEFSIDTNYDSYVYLNPGIQPWVSLDVWASILWGVAEVGMNFTPTFGIEFPCTLYVYPDPHPATHHCTYFVLNYSVWGSVGWGIWKGTLWGPGTGFYFDEPEGCHWGKYEFEVTPPIAAMIDSVLQYLPQVFETPSAAVDPNSNRVMVVWIHDRYPEDTLLTDPDVYYGFLDSTEGAEWVYGSITENEKWETNPKVAFLSSDSVIAVWTQNEIPKADWGSVTELNTVLSNQELYYSICTISSGGWTEPIRITTNSLPDGCADLQARNGKAIMAWVKDLDGDLNTRTDWEVFYSWYDTSGWSTPAVLSDGLGSNFEPAVALNDSTGQAIVVWTHEPDGDFNTPDDRGLYYKYIDPTSGPAPLGTDLPHEMGPLSPSVAFAPGRNPVVAYTSRSVEWDSVSAEWDTLGVGLRDELFFSYFKDDVWHSMQVTVDGDSVIAMNPVVKVDNTNRAMIVYRGFEGEGVAAFDGEIFSVYIDLSSGAPKGENHVQYTSDTATTWMPTFDINNQGDGKLVYVTYRPEPPDTGLDNIWIETPAWVSPYLRGDANGDSAIDIADVMYLINYLFISGSAPDPLWVGDCNCDETVDVADVMYLINYLFIGGSPPGC